VLLSHHQTGREHPNFKVANKSFECGKFQIFNKAVRNQNCIHGDTKRGPDYGSACCHAVQNYLPVSHVITQGLKHAKNIVFSIDFCGCEIWFLTLREEHIKGA
jgi:hypothetical protein